MKNHLSDIFYRVPEYANTTMTKTHLRETLLATDGWIMACGSIYDIKPKHLGAGIYKVVLKRR